MDNAKLIKAREYYDRVSGGEGKQSVSLELYGKKNADVEKSPEYLAIVSAVTKLQREELKSDLEKVKRKQLKAYSTLLDKGEELMDQADNLADKLAAQANQRENLSTGVVENAVAWDGEDRNKSDMGDVLEGVVIS